MLRTQDPASPGRCSSFVRPVVGSISAWSDSIAQSQNSPRKDVGTNAHFPLRHPVYASTMMGSTNNNTDRGLASPLWRDSGLRYYSYNFHLRQRFGFRVQKVSIDAGFTCPNVDGTVAIGGCTFCDNRSFSPSRRIPRREIRAQIDEGIRRLKLRYTVDHFTAYFQPATNTYAPVEKLRPLYEQALEHPKVVAMAIGTRPDCVPNDVLDLLQSIGEQTYLSVEYGLESMHNRSLDWMNRGHHHDAFLDAIERSQGRGFEICAHVMLGLPGETREDMLDTAREVARLGIDSVKIHNLYAVKNTELAEQVESGEAELISLDDYVSVIVDFLELLPPSMIVERISGDAPPDYLVGPEWCLDKPNVLRQIEAELERRDSFQGRCFAGSAV